MNYREFSEAALALYAYDTGCTDSGIHDERLKERVLAHALEHPWNVMKLSLEAGERDGYTEEDTVDLLQWFQRDLLLDWGWKEVRTHQDRIVDRDQIVRRAEQLYDLSCGPRTTQEHHKALQALLGAVFTYRFPSGAPEGAQEAPGSLGGDKPPGEGEDAGEGTREAERRSDE